ncbi:MAG: AAA family ATPase [bacterium]
MNQRLKKAELEVRAPSFLGTIDMMYHKNENSRQERPEIELKPSQASTFDRLLAFLKSPDERCFILKGYAGTGKTFLIKKVVEWLVASHRGFALMAPTGRAAMVLRQRVQHPAFTIHKSIYTLDRLREFEDSDHDFKYYFAVRDIADREADLVYIVDESSMLSDVYSEGEYLRFGSGRLLKDLIEFSKVQSEHIRSKIIFVGDPAQLPPVNSRVSHALDATYLENAFGLKSVGAVLTDVVRQEEGSLLLSNATEIRTSIADQLFNRFELTFGEDTQLGSSRDVVPYCFESGSLRPREDTIVVTFRNRTALDYNKLLRGHSYGGGGDQAPRTGDRFVVTQNNAAFGLLNGDFVEVVTAASDVETHRWRDAELTFRDVQITYTDPDGHRVMKQCKIIDSLLLAPEPGLTKDQYKALYVDFKIRNDNLKPNTEAFRLALGSDPYYNALRVKYGYAITCHKAQGGEWPRVVTIFEGCHGWTTEPAFRWMYTAITRAKHQLLAVDPPVFKPFPMPLCVPDIIEPALANSQYVLTQEELTQHQFPEESPFLIAYFKGMTQVLAPTGIKITSIEHGQFFERYTLTKEAESVTLDFYYKGNGVFTGNHRLCRVQKPGDLLTEIENKLQNIHPIYENEPEKPFPAPPVGREFLSETYVALKASAARYGVSIHWVKHGPWSERYCFQKAGAKALIDFYYNKRWIFTASSVVGDSSPDIVAAVSGLLKPEYSEA